MNAGSLTADEQAAILDYYARGGEENRLQQGIGQLEFVRTCELLRRHLPPSPATIIDVGGGAGLYAVWLAEQGYRVHLFDLAAENVALARAAAAARGLEISCEVADARALSLKDGVAEGVLLLGPLYHLPTAVERQQALAECARILKPGGVVCAAVISRYIDIFWAQLQLGERDYLLDEAFQGMLWEELASGQHVTPLEHPELFTRAYFHLPAELQAEIVEAGLIPRKLYAVEGPSWMVPDFESRWADPSQRELLLELVRRTENASAIMGVSPHIMGVGVKV